MLISVIVPVYNAEKFLDRCIESVENQSYESIELILVDDGSTDSSKMICDKYALADNRIKVFSQKNSGPSAARNSGIRHATGDFVFFLDADDFIEKHTMEILIEKYRQYQPDLVMANFRKLENNGDIIKQSVAFHPDDVPFKHPIKELSKKDALNYVRHFLKHPSNHLISYCWARLYKLSIIKDHKILSDEELNLFEDLVFNLEYLKHTRKTVFVNESLYTYTMHNSHISVSMAIVDGESLVHDMNVFKNKVSEFSQQIHSGRENEFYIKKEIGHALVHYAIIFLIRTCRLITRQTLKKIYSEIVKIIHAPIFKESLQCYSPSKGNSRVLPLLMKFNLVYLMMFFCKYKAYKRYGKPRDPA